MSKTPPKERKKIADGINPIGMWSVFRKTETKKAHFCCLHDTRDSAVEEAQRLATELIAFHGPAKDAIFFVVLMDSQVGLGGGKLHAGTESALDKLQTIAYAEGRKDESEHWLAETGVDNRPS